MNKKYLIVGLVLLVLVMPSLVLAEEYEAHCISDGDAQEVGVQCWPKIPSFSCPFEEKEGRIIVEFNNRMRADKGWSFAHELVSAHIPKGTYKVSLSSFDGYIGRRNVVQHYEQWYAVLMRSTSQYDTITATNFIHDVPDPSNKDYASITMKVNDLLIVPEDASYVMAVHSYFGHPIIKGPESLDPICAAFDRISDNTVYCPDADMIFDVHMSVVSEAHHSKKTTDSTIIDIPMQGSHVVKGVVERGNPGQCQTGEEFYMEINGITGHVVEDDIEPCAMNTTLEYLGTYYFGMGGNIVYMHSTNDTSSSNSVSLNQLCLYYDDDVLCPFEIGDFCTQSQGGWGSPSNSGPGSMRDNNWDYVIGGSLIVGIGYNMTFTGPEYVKDYLPEGGTPSSLTQSYTNPDSSQTNVFAGQVTALKLNVLYSDAGIGLITPGLDVSIGELYVKYGKFEGITVYQLLDIAEKVLGGDNSVLSPYSASVSDLNDAVSKVNENFVDCNVDKGYLEWLTCEDDPVLGSITFCKELLDPQGSLSDGNGLDVSFRLNTSLGFVDWALPLSYDDGLDCVLFDELVLGSYYYDAEIINNYEDMIFWYGALYSLDGGPLVDYSDGTIVLSEEYPDRTLVVRNKYGVVPEPEPVTIKAYKIVCEDESYLPDWGLAVNPLKPTQITPAVIESFLEDNEGYCWYEEDWDFQYGFDVVKLPGDHVGYALESDGAGYWKNFTSTTTVDGPAIVTISDLEGFNRIWVREVLQEGYLPFANPPGDLQDSYSAEFYCHKDILNFDNYDRIDNPVMGGTYYCVGFNTPIPDDPVLGSINVCKRVLDENGTVISGVGLNTTFTVPMMGLDDAVFSTPLSYDSYDVECLLYDELELGDYVFGSEVIDGPDNVKWLSPYYEPVYGDYTISLTLDSPDRTLLVVNQIDEIIIVESFRGSITFCKQLLDENGVIIDGEGLDVSFMLNTSLGMITYDMPLSYYDDADCITYYNLTLQEYYYDPESILSNEHLLVWEEPLYGLDGNTPVLYDNGMILLDEDNRNRTLLIINQYDIIDVPVCIDIDYTMPYYNNGSAQWIDTESRVVLNINDSIDACIMADHYYRYHIVSEEYCLNSCSSWAPNYNGNSWSEYEGPFPLGVEACYVIEYYTDSPGNVDDTIMWDCIFMDKTLPTINKEVGHYKSYWDGTSSPYYPEAPLHCGENGGSECWEVTLSTPITISCADEGYYPSGVSKMCFIIEFNGDDVTQDYCGIYDGEMDDGQCCLSGDSIVMNFQKESWHKLSLTCTDNVGKQSSSVQYYKVGGKTFEIVLNKKWNLISIPIALSDNSIESIFEGHENSIAAIWAFDGKNWMVWSPEGPNSLTHMHPGWGYWVLATDDINITVGGSLMNPAVTPPAKTIVEGWNLIGYYGMEGAPMNSYGLKYYNGPNIYGDGMSSYCALSTLLSNAWDTPLPSLWTYWEPNNPQPWIPLNVNAGHYMNPGAGYWLYYSKKGGASYAPSTSCGMPLSTFSV
ncbi:MAG: hypothetical protein ACMXYL_04470 [Candidatus Woesearchaeota archaeon]